NCDAVKCGPGGNCTRDVNGNPSCSCSTGFKLSFDKLSCIDSKCFALGCSPGGTCAKDNSTGLLYCKWDTPCGRCPTGATCNTTLEIMENSLAPYCVCPAGYGMTQDACIKGGVSTVGAASMTFDSDQVRDGGSRPYTVRANINTCTPVPKERVGNFTRRYLVFNTNDGTPLFRSREYWTGNNCTGELLLDRRMPITPLFAQLI
ncbi:unnamed protein product, partial [Closterium sp. Naga37s-1]